MKPKEGQKVSSLQHKYVELMELTEIECNDSESLAQPYEVKFVESFTTNHTIDPEAQ